MLSLIQIILNQREERTLTIKIKETSTHKGIFKVKWIILKEVIWTLRKMTLITSIQILIGTIGWTSLNGKTLIIRMATTKNSSTTLESIRKITLSMGLKKERTKRTRRLATTKTKASKPLKIIINNFNNIKESHLLWRKIIFNMLIPPILIRKIPSIKIETLARLCKRIRMNRSIILTWISLKDHPEILALDPTLFSQMTPLDWTKEAAEELQRKLTKN